MPDIDPAALSRPAVSLSTPVLSSKSLSTIGVGAQKLPKVSQTIPARIDLEPLYATLKSAIGSEQWLIYKESMTEFMLGRLNQAEFSERIDPVLAGPGEKEHHHNQLIAAIYGNVTREMPDLGLAPWVSANDKPAAVQGSKPVTGDAAERRLKDEVMQLPARDRRRIKELVHNDYDPHESIANMFAEPFRKSSAVPEVPPSAGGGINKMNFDLEIRKRFAQPLAIESGEFPDDGTIGARMLPLCYEAGLANGHVSDAPHLMSIAADTFIKEVLTQIFSRTRSNGPGDSASAGFGVGTTWIQTHRYKKQLHHEEDAAMRGEVSRDKSGMLPIEAKAASERSMLGMGDLRLSLEMADTGMTQYPIIFSQIVYGYREGELENWDDYSWVHDMCPVGGQDDAFSSLLNGSLVQELPNGHPDSMDVDMDSLWEGTESHDVSVLDSMLDSCLAVGV